MSDREQWAQLLVSDAGGAAAYVDHTVATGITERIVAAWGTHNDVAARDCRFGLIDSVSGVAQDMSDATSKAGGTYLHLYDLAKCPENIILREGHVLRFNVASLDHAGGKRATMYLIVERLKGQDSYGA
jgi:hypothetical protein